MQGTGQANRELIMRLIEAGNKQDMETTKALIAPGAVIHMLYDATDPITHEPAGREEDFDPAVFDERIAYDQKMFSEELSTVDYMFDVGEDMVLTIGTFASTHRSGKRVSTQSVSLDRIAGGKVVESWFLGDRLGYWQQLGLVPPTSELLKKLEAL